MAGLIEDYAVLGDLHTAALAGRDGSIDWACFPRFDSPAVFAALLGTPDHGRWLLAPAAGGMCSRRSYRGDSLILATEWDTPEGTVRVLDFMPPRAEAPDIVRIVEGLSGSVPMTMELRLRLDYGRILPWVRQADGELVAVAGPDALYLATPVPVAAGDAVSTSTFTVRAGQRVPFVLTWQASHRARPQLVDPDASFAETERFWAEWSARCRYDGEWRDAVMRSLLVLKSLTYHPTGGIIAAPTTSLPESLGGPRNWDYRYCWLRDSTMTLHALVYAGYREEAVAWREWLLRAIAGSLADLRVVYGLAGEQRITEQEAPWLPGYEGSQPVRIGNAASGQFQLDVWGEVMDSLHLVRESDIGVQEDMWAFQQALMEGLEGRWQEPDAGLWESRGAPQAFVHSRVMAWVAADRAVRAVERSGLPGPLARWRELRASIKREVCARGYDTERNSFVRAYGSRDLDAALLLIPQVGFLPAHDERVVGTVEAVQRELTTDGLVLRYRDVAGADGIAGGEGVFLACSFWLADSLDLIGRPGQARALFERLLTLRNDVGLLSEEYDVARHRQLGNTPQAFTHVPLVTTARALSRSGRGRGRTPRSDPPRAADHGALAG
ncbi:MAG TPA: glycoside hydrolase family 15 protein [Mycobacteriales bacterium]|nr:glycoside hydrolase family 15 protein [Mycobacteriales bacterium]